LNILSLIRFVAEISLYVYEIFINFDKESLALTTKSIILAPTDIKS